MSRRKIKKEKPQKEHVPTHKPTPLKHVLEKKQKDRKLERHLILQAKVQNYLDENEVDVNKLNMYDYLQHLSNALDLSAGMIEKVLRNLQYIK